MKNKDEEEPSYKVRIAWDSGLFSNYYQSHTVDRDAVYFYERPPGYNQVNIYTLTRLDAETGRFKWRTPMFSDIVFCQPIIIGNYVYVFIETNIIICFNRETGEHTATVKMKIENKDLGFRWNVNAYQQNLYFGFASGKDSFFVSVDVNLINQNGDPEKIQEITPEILWEPDTGCTVTAKAVVHNNIVYTSTYNYFAYYPVELAGFDINTRQMVFYKTFGGPVDLADNIPYPETGGNLQSNPIFIHDNILYYLYRSINAWNLTTYEQLYRHIFTDDVPIEKRYMAGICLQPAFHNGKFYYTQSVSYEPNKWRNIHCIDAKTGELVWNDIAKDSETLDTNPIIAHGKLYVSQHSGLRVYNPETGKLIGVDSSFCGMGMGRNVLYNDYMICVRMNRDTGDGKLVAVYVGK